LLHHSRYAVEDRTWPDQQLLSIFGPNGKRGGIVAITTQTAEQSLDIDADLLITDACPADVLLQRLGRLHRHRAGTSATAVMIDPGTLDQYLLANGKVLDRVGQGWPWLYNNLLSVRATLDSLRSGRVADARSSSALPTPTIFVKWLSHSVEVGRPSGAVFSMKPLSGNNWPRRA
jgi:CRISPR-associated endonuclease/helicase Cas3